jgi:hypothetical protein
MFGEKCSQTGLLGNISSTQRSGACRATSGARPCAAAADPTVGPARTPRPHGHLVARAGALDGVPTASLPHPARATRPRSPRRPASRVAAVRLALSHHLARPIPWLLWPTCAMVVTSTQGTSAYKRCRSSPVCARARPRCPAPPRFTIEVARWTLVPALFPSYPNL